MYDNIFFMLRVGRSQGSCWFICRRYVCVAHGRVVGLKEKGKLSSKGRYFDLDHPNAAVYDDAAGNEQSGSKDSTSAFFLERRKKIVQFFLPKNYPHTVNDDYWDVQKHWNMQWATSSALQVFATQSLLTSVGVGTGAALPLAATANWVLKVQCISKSNDPSSSSHFLGCSCLCRGNGCCK